MVSGEVSVETDMLQSHFSVLMNIAGNDLLELSMLALHLPVIVNIINRSKQNAYVIDK